MELLSRFLKHISLVLLLHISSYAGVLPFFNPLLDRSTISFQAQVLVANNALSLESIFEDKDTGLNNKKGDYTAINDERVDIGTDIDKFGYLGYTYRNNIFINMSNDAMKFLYKVKYKKDLKLNKKYNIEAYAEEFETQGITYSNSFIPYISNFSMLKVGFALSFMKATNGQVAKLTGHATSLGNKDYNYEANLKYAYNENFLYDYKVKSHTGYGYNINFALEWIEENYYIQLLVNDIFSHIYWESLAYSTVIASSENKEYDENGYPIYKPAVKGKEGYKPYTQEVSPRYETEVMYKITTNNYIYLGSDYYNQIFFPYLNLKHSISENLNIDLGYETFFKMFNIALHYKNWGIEIKSNSIYKPFATSVVFSGGYSF